MTVAAVAGFASGTEHLLTELAWLELVLRRQVARLRAANLITEDDFRGLYIADAQVDALLAAGDDDPGSAPALETAIARVREESEARLRATPDADLLPLPRIARIFGLDVFELDVLVIALAPELDLRWETLYAYVQNDVTRRRPTVDLALKLLCGGIEERLARRAAFADRAPLVRNRLVRLLDDAQERDPPLLGRYLKADDRIVDFLLEGDGLERDLQPFVRCASPRGGLDTLALPSDVVARLRTAWPALGAAGGAVLLHGPAGSGKAAIAEAFAGELGVDVVAADLAAGLAREPDAAAIATLLAREALLRGALLYLGRAEVILAGGGPARAHAGALLRALEPLRVPLVFGSDAPWDPNLEALGGRVLTVEVAPPGFPARRELWQRALGADAENVDISELAARFKLGPARIADAAIEARTLAELRPAHDRRLTTADAYTAARSQSSQALHGLAEKVEAAYEWSDIVLPARPLHALRAVCTSVRFRHVVYSDWGFDRKIAHGKGLNVLFSGPSGTGKTMAATIVARELDLDLFKIDLAGVVSKYIGETEQNLRRIFRAARECNAILFFDEADALFGKRSEVRDAHDRYANIEVAYLLQQMEDYDGVVILATNLSKNLDQAFARRLDHVIEFPFPDEEHRARIWRAVLPPEAPLDGAADLDFLARRFELAGGNIRNIVVAAAFRAAEQARPIRMEDLIHATARELEKLGRLPTRADFREYYELIFGAA